MLMESSYFIKALGREWFKTSTQGTYKSLEQNFIIIYVHVTLIITLLTITEF